MAPGDSAGPPPPRPPPPPPPPASVTGNIPPDGSAGDGEDESDREENGKGAVIGGLARGSLELGAINVTAPALDPASIREVVASEHGTLQGCYVQALDEAPDLSGTLEVTFSIGGDGRVTQVEGRGDGPLVAAGVEACVVEAFRGFTFPASNEPRTTTVTYPLTFTPR